MEFTHTCLNLCVRWLACGVLLTSLQSVWAAPVPQQDTLPTSDSPQAFIAPVLEINGPVGQTVMVYVRYYQDGTATRTVGIRHTVDQPNEAIPLDIGVEGIRIWLVNPSRETITLSVRDGDRQLGAEQGGGPAALELAIGSVPAEDAFQVPRVLLNAAEQNIVHRFVQVLRGESSRELLADPPLARIDWPTLDAFAAYARTHFGTPGAQADDLDGWLSWEGELGTRILHGRLEFPAQPQARFSLVVVRHRIIHITFEGLELPDDWFVRPVDASTYIGQAERLTYLLATGRAERALAMFSPSYRDGVELADIQGLVARLKAKYGQDVRQVEFKQTVVGAYDFDLQTRPFYVDHAVQFESDKRCICRVTFMFPCNAKRIARGHLALVDFSETWPSASPELAAMARQAIEQLAVAAQSLAQPDSAVPSLDSLPWSPQLESIVDAAQRDEILCNCLRFLGPMTQSVDWDLWYGNADLPYPFLEGNIEFERAAALVRIDLLDDGMLGITILADRLADSTLRAVAPAPSVREHSRNFWNALIGGDIAAAHDRLAEPFARQLPLERLQGLRDASGITSATHRIANIFIDAPMISNRRQRLFPVMVAACGVIEFEAAAPITVLTEYGLPAGTPELFDFSTEVEARYPAADDHSPQALVAALADPSGESLLGLLAPPDRAQAVPELTRGFLGKLRAAAEAFPVDLVPPVRVMHVYRPGAFQKRIGGVMAGGSTEFPFTAHFEFDALKALQVEIPGATGFLDQVDMPAVLQRVVPRTVNYLVTGTRQEWSHVLVAGLQTPETLQRLEKIQAEWRGLWGEYRATRIESMAIDADANGATVDARIEFSGGVIRTRLDFEIDIFTARLSGIAPLPQASPSSAPVPGEAP
ncbi:MAG: hypothetical protein D6753_07900 [Planctomycetota bacterium]|nr:MAG: hypothetical protein D6753_07900 [Planctomycetota bacterium]